MFSGDEGDISAGDFPSSGPTIGVSGKFNPFREL